MTPEEEEELENYVPYLTTEYSYMTEEEMQRNKEREEREINALIHEIQFPTKSHHVRNNIIMFIIVVMVGLFLIYTTGNKNANERLRHNNIRHNVNDNYGLRDRCDVHPLGSPETYNHINPIYHYSVYNICRYTV